MNNQVFCLNEYFRFKFWMNIELNRFWARFNVWMNFQNVSHWTSQSTWYGCGSPSWTNQWQLGPNQAHWGLPRTSRAKNIANWPKTTKIGIFKMCKKEIWSIYIYPPWWLLTPRCMKTPPKKQKSTQKGPNMAKNSPKWKNAIFSKSPNGPILKFFLVTGEVRVISENFLDLPVLLIFVGVASSA